MAQKAILKFVKDNKTTSDVIRISQGEFVERVNNYSHIEVHANDFVGDPSTQLAYMLAPFDCVVKALGTSSGNTVFFESTCEVETAAGNIEPVVSFMCTHMNQADYDAMQYYVGKPFTQGEVIYREGIAGEASGPHIHLEQALGGYNGTNGSTPSIKNGNVTWLNNNVPTQVYRINADNPVSCTSVFFAGNDIVAGQSDTAKGYIWTKLDGSKWNGRGELVEEAPTNPDPTPEPDTPSQPATETFSITGYGLYVNNLGLNIRSLPTANSAKLKTVSVGGELKIREFLHGFQEDGYQWAAVEHNGIRGYSQIDTHGYYTVLKTATSVIHPESGRTVTPRNLYIVASSSGAYIKKTPTSTASADRTFISPGSKMKVIELYPGFQNHDGYQYAYVNYNGNVEGYVQIDVYSWHYFQVI